MAGETLNIHVTLKAAQIQYIDTHVFFLSCLFT